MREQTARLLRLVLLGVLLSTAPWVQATGTQKVTQELRRQYTRFYGAYKRNDYKSMLDVLAPQFRQKAVGGSIALRSQMPAIWKEALSQVKSSGLLIKPFPPTFRVQSVSVRGNQAFVVGQEKQEYDARRPGALPEPGAIEVIEVRRAPEVVHDRWVKTPTGWLLKERTYHSGKP